MQNSNDPVNNNVNDYLACGKLPLSKVVKQFGEAWVRRWVALNNFEAKRVLSSVGI